MDIQTRKIIFIQEFLKLQSEDIIKRLENLLKKEKMKTHESFNPMTQDELDKRIDLSLKDSEEEKVIESSELLSEIKKWD